MQLSAIIKFLISLGIDRNLIRTHESSEWAVCPCPLSKWTHKHGADNNPSFNIKIDNNRFSGFYCFSCGYKGSLFALTKYLYKFSGINNSEAYSILKSFEFFKGVDLDELNKVHKIDIIKPLEEKYNKIYDKAWKYFDARAYLIKRGISEATCDILNLGYDEIQNRVVFPVYGVKGELYGFTGRAVFDDIIPKVRDYLGLPKRRLLLGVNLYQKGKPFLVVEGLFGLAHLIEIGARDFCNPVAILGSELTQDKADILISFNENVYILSDNDEAGDKCLFGVLDEQGKPRGGGAIDRLYNNVNLYIPSWLNNKKDPDELTYDEVKGMIENTPLYIK
jgi:DNA primase